MDESKLECLEEAGPKDAEDSEWRTYHDDCNFAGREPAILPGHTYAQMIINASDGTQDRYKGK
jgi:hypothetical protein